MEDKDKLFTKEKSLFQKQINETMTDRDNTETIKDLIKLILLKNAGKDESMMKLVEVYNYLGIEEFVDIIDIMNGQTVEFPSIEEFKDTIRIAICYYYKYMKNQSWDEIKTILDDQDCSSIKYGINCSKLNRFITELADYQKRSEERRVGKEC